MHGVRFRKMEFGVGAISTYWNHGVSAKMGKTGKQSMELKIMVAIVFFGRSSNPIMRTTAIVVLLAAIACGAQEQRFVYPVPAADAFTLRNDLVYKHAGEKALGLDLFLPADAARGRLPVLLIFNGFGGTFMRDSPQAQGWAKAATAHGFAAITVETTEGRVADDFDSLVDYLAKDADELHVDPERIAVIAWSGNGPSALSTVEDSRRKAVKAAIFLYGWGVAEVSQVRLDLPVLFVRAGLDQPEANRELDHVTAAGILANAPWTVLNYPGGRHGFDVLDDNDLSREIIDEAFHFAQSAMSDSHQAALRGGLAEANAAGAIATGDFAKAVNLYRTIVAAHPGDARLLLAYGNALAGAMQYKEARAQFDRAKAIGGLGARDLGLPAARACALDHDPEAAMAWLRGIPRQFLPAAVQSDPGFLSLKDRKDFRALFQK